MRLSILILALAVCLVTTTPAFTSGIQELVGFPCTSTHCPDGAQPAAIIQASDSNFYGVAEASIPGGGTIFKMTPTGKLTELFVFLTQPGTGFFPNGYAPNSIAEGSDGLLYGANGVGGPTSSSSGTLWRIQKDGKGFQVLQQFCTSCANGSYPNNIIAASDGNLYGTTGYGGSFNGNVCSSLGCGVVFKLTTSGVYTVLHALAGGTETSDPIGITQASDGNFYGGTAYLGGGALFRVTPSGSYTTLLDLGSGNYALTPMTQASNGLLYGFSHVVNASTVELFSLSLSGTFQNIAAVTQSLFKQFGLGQPLQATDSNLWVPAFIGGSSNLGRVFSITTSGTVLDSFSFNGTDGANPVKGLIQTADGTLYGTATKKGTASGGAAATGVIYTISGLPPKR
jgi:uncharacterized repeat protein (TIGR03803 family)